jgi:hypothetical protein
VYWISGRMVSPKVKAMVPIALNTPNSVSALSALVP